MATSAIKPQVSAVVRWFRNFRSAVFTWHPGLSAAELIKMMDVTALAGRRVPVLKVFAIASGSRRSWHDSWDTHLLLD
jgi:hypothetical protein